MMNCRWTNPLLTSLYEQYTSEKFCPERLFEKLLKAVQSGHTRNQFVTYARFQLKPGGPLFLQILQSDWLRTSYLKPGGPLLFFSCPKMEISMPNMVISSTMTSKVEWTIQYSLSNYADVF